MKHKQDAIFEAERVIKRHVSSGLNQLQAHKAALITIQESSMRNDSLNKRAENYLIHLLVGEETLVEILRLQQEQKKLYNQLPNWYDWYESLSAEKRKEIKKSGVLPYEYLRKEADNFDFKIKDLLKQ